MRIDCKNVILKIAVRFIICSTFLYRGVDNIAGQLFRGTIVYRTYVP